MTKSTGKLLLIKVLQEEISENMLSIIVCLEHMLFKSCDLVVNCSNCRQAQFIASLELPRLYAKWPQLKTVLVSCYEIIKKGRRAGRQKEEV